MLSLRHALTMVLVAAGLACCGGSDAVSIDQIPPDKKLVDLNSSEQQGVCDWGEDIARQALPPGTNCHGNAITIGGCFTIAPACPATVAQWKGCLPTLVDRLASDPCQIIELSFSPSDLETFIDQIPGCENVGPCATTVHQ